MSEKPMCTLTEQEHEREVKEYIFANFSEFAQIKAVNAIQELIDDGKEWR